MQLDWLIRLLIYRFLYNKIQDMMPISFQGWRQIVQHFCEAK